MCAARPSGSQIGPSHPAVTGRSFLIGTGIRTDGGARQDIEEPDDQSGAGTELQDRHEVRTLAVVPDPRDAADLHFIACPNSQDSPPSATSGQFRIADAPTGAGDTTARLRSARGNRFIMRSAGSARSRLISSSSTIGQSIPSHALHVDALEAYVHPATPAVVVDDEVGPSAMDVDLAATGRFSKLGGVALRLSRGGERAVMRDAGAAVPRRLARCLNLLSIGGAERDRVSAKHGPRSREERDIQVAAVSFRRKGQSLESAGHASALS